MQNKDIGKFGIGLASCKSETTPSPQDVEETGRNRQIFKSNFASPFGPSPRPLLLSLMLL